jgi:hypothetical protein
VSRLGALPDPAADERVIGQYGQYLALSEPREDLEKCRLYPHGG